MKPSALCMIVLTKIIVNIVRYFHVAFPENSLEYALGMTHILYRSKSPSFNDVENPFGSKGVIGPLNKPTNIFSTIYPKYSVRILKYNQLCLRSFVYLHS